MRHVCLLVLLLAGCASQEEGPSQYLIDYCKEHNIEYEIVRGAKPSQNPRDRFREIGNKINPTQAELREYLMLDARFSVEEGQMTVNDFEQWTGETY